MTNYRVTQVAELSGVTVRTLHHYDAIGLLKPGRTESGYRVYTDDDILRLQQILVARELGLPLETIKTLLDDPTIDRRALLNRQRDELKRREAKTQEMIRSLDAALMKLNSERNRPMTKQEIEALFEGFDASQYEAEARERWGNTEAYKESARRTKSYSKEDWSRYKSENAELMAELVSAMTKAEPVDSKAVMALAERHRLSIDRWFYPCSREMHRKLADMYEQDERFASSFDDIASGLAAYLVSAIRANRDDRPEDV